MIDYTKCHTTIKKFNLNDEPKQILLYNPKRFKATVVNDFTGGYNAALGSTPSELDKMMVPYYYYTGFDIIGPYEYWAKAGYPGIISIIDVIEYILD